MHDTAFIYEKAFQFEQAATEQKMLRLPAIEPNIASARRGAAKKSFSMKPAHLIRKSNRCLFKDRTMIVLGMVFEHIHRHRIAIATRAIIGLK